MTSTALTLHQVIMASKQTKSFFTQFFKTTFWSKWEVFLTTHKAPHREMRGLLEFQTSDGFYSVSGLIFFRLWVVDKERKQTRSAEHRQFFVCVVNKTSLFHRFERTLEGCPLRTEKRAQVAFAAGQFDILAARLCQRNYPVCNGVSSIEPEVSDMRPVIEVCALTERVFRKLNRKTWSLLRIFI